MIARYILAWLWKGGTMSESERQLGYYFRRINGQFEKHRNHGLRQYDLTSSQFDVLFYLKRREKAGELNTIQKDIEQYFHISNPSVSGIISRLEQKGYVERVRSETDRRTCYIRTTAKEKEIEKDLQHQRDSMDHRIRSLYGDDRYRHLIQDLDQLLNVLLEIEKEDTNA